MMTGREKIEAAFAPDGSSEFGAVIPYEGIFIRDHCDSLTRCPWWLAYSPDLEQRLVWHREVIERIGQDWFGLPWFLPRSERAVLALVEEPDGVVLIDQRSGRRQPIEPPRKSGWSAADGVESVANRVPEDADEIDEAIPVEAMFELEYAFEDGVDDLARRLTAEFGDTHVTHAQVNSPLWSTYGLWGFEGMMESIATRPDLVARACNRLLTNAVRNVAVLARLGADIVWVEECLTDTISPDAYARLNAPCLRVLFDTIRSAGMRSIYYYCGDPRPHWNQIVTLGMDALALEESKKGFRIDIAEVAQRVDGRFTLLGNLDAVGVLADADEVALKAEIRRQVAAGRRNRSRFVVSLGSPVTPETSIDRIRLFCDFAHDVGR